MSEIFTLPVLIAFALGVLLAAMVKGLVASLKSKVA